MDPLTPSQSRRLLEDEHTDVTRSPTEPREDATTLPPANEDSFLAPDPTTRQTASITVSDYALGPGASLGEYKIEGVLGQGGMGIVYQAAHPLIGKRAAIKVLKKELCADPQAVQRFIDEARVVNEIGHPNIVDVFAFGEMPDGRSYFVMELLKGETMRARAARKPLDLVELASVLRPLARALEAAHEKNIIHRDLKPDNVFFVDMRGEGPMVKLLDFGIAKLARRDSARVERTATGTMVGTPQYIAPEQARGYAIDHRVDIYSLGCITFELLTGRPPFVADNAMDMVAKHLLEPAPRPSSVVATVPAELDDHVHAMMAKEAADRPPLSALIALLDRVGPGASRASVEIVPLSPPRPPAPAPEVLASATMPVPVPASVTMSGAHEDVVTARPTEPVPAEPSAAHVIPTETAALTIPHRSVRPPASRWPWIAAALALLVGAVAFWAVESAVSTPAETTAPTAAPPTPAPVAMPAPAPAPPAPPLPATPLPPTPAPAIVAPAPPAPPAPHPDRHLPTTRHLRPVTAPAPIKPKPPKPAEPKPARPLVVPNDNGLMP